MNDIVREVLEEHELNGGEMLAGFESALIGYTCGRGDLRPVYEYNRCLEVLLIRGGCDTGADADLEAVNWMEFNVVCALRADEGPEMVELGYEINIPPEGVLKVIE